MKKIAMMAMLALLLIITGTVAANPGQKYRAHLTGAEEVPPVDTVSQGQINFTLSEDGTSLHYKLIVANLHNILQAHIHVGAVGVNGGVVAFLYPDAPPPQLIEGRFSGVLAEGDITAEDLRGSLLGMPLSALVAEMDAGNTYVNVHTVSNPGGEIRGQIR